MGGPQMTTCSPLAEHHLQLEPHKKRGCDLRWKQHLTVHQSVTSALRVPDFPALGHVPGRVVPGRTQSRSWRNCSIAGLHLLSLPCSEWWMTGSDKELVKKEGEDAGSYTSFRPSSSSTCSSPTGAPWDQAGWQRLQRDTQKRGGGFT